MYVVRDESRPVCSFLVQFVGGGWDGAPGVWRSLLLGEWRSFAAVKADDAQRGVGRPRVWK